jgi:hypothetical protein
MEKLPERSGEQAAVAEPVVEPVVVSSDASVEDDNRQREMSIARFSLLCLG